MKLVVDERESDALRAYLAPFAESLAASVIAAVEVPRVARRTGRERYATSVLENVAWIGLDDVVIARASALDPATLRSLDAIHLATALSLGDAVDAFVAYDARLAEAARVNGLAVVSPA